MCLDEALHYKHARWSDRDIERQKREDDGGEDASDAPNLYSTITNDSRVGRPPGIAELRLLPTIEPEDAAAVAD